MEHLAHNPPEVTQEGLRRTRKARNCPLVHAMILLQAGEFRLLAVLKSASLHPGDDALAERIGQKDRLLSGFAVDLNSCFRLALDLVFM